MQRIYVHDPAAVARRPMPLRQSQVLAFVRSRPRFPSYSEIAQHMGWKDPSSAYDCLVRLSWRGLVRRVKGSRPTRWELVEGKTD